MVETGKGLRPLPEPKGEKMFDVSKFFIVVEEFKGKYSDTFNFNDAYVVHENDILGFLSFIWDGKYSQDYAREGWHQPNEYMRYNVRRPRRRG